MAIDALAGTYQLTHDEAAKQSFVGSLKSYLRNSLEGQLDEKYAQLRDSLGEAKSAQDALKQDAIFKLWESTVYCSQDMMWETVGETVDRLHGSYQKYLQNGSTNNTSEARLELSADLTIPEPIASHEIHRQPGGYFHGSEKDDLIAPLMYFGSRELYMNSAGAKGGTAAGMPAISNAVLAALNAKAPGFRPKRILDLGCGTGTETRAYCQAFPDSEVYGVDLSAPFLKFAHLWAEAHGDEIHYRQANAADTGYPDGHFDLIVSTILFHETSHEVLPQIMKESRRLLAPGGLVVHADVPFQLEKLSERERVTSDWQVAYNGEPFWTEYGKVDLYQALLEAGFTPDEAFSEYMNFGSLDMMMFGAKLAGGAA